MDVLKKEASILCRKRGFSWICASLIWVHKVKSYSFVENVNLSALISIAEIAKITYSTFQKIIVRLRQARFSPYSIEMASDIDAYSFVLLHKVGLRKQRIADISCLFYEYFNGCKQCAHLYLMLFVENEGNKLMSMSVCFNSILEDNRKLRESKNAHTLIIFVYMSWFYLHWYGIFCRKTTNRMISLVVDAVDQNKDVFKNCPCISLSLVKFFLPSLISLVVILLVEYDREVSSKKYG